MKANIVLTHISSMLMQDDEEDYSDVITDPTFLQSVLEGLPGVDPQSAAIRSAVGQLTDSQKKDKKKNEDPSKDDKKWYLDAVEGG